MTHTDSQGNVYGLGLIPATEAQKRAVCALHEGANIPRSQWQEVSYLAYAPDRYDQGQQGSCFPAETRIRMADGTNRQINRVRLLDEVLTAEGNVGAVTRLFTRPAESLVSLSLWGHGHLRMTDEHPVLTRRGYISASQLRLDDWVALPRYIRHSHRQIQTANHVKAARRTVGGDRRIRYAGVLGRGEVVVRATPLPDIIDLTPGFGRIVGLFLAEGNTDTNKVVWSFNINEEETLVAELLRLLDGTLGVEGRIQRRANNCIKVCLYGKQWATLFESLCSTGSGFKQLHADLTGGPIEFQQAILEGWLAGDGYSRRASRMGTTVSHDLALSMYDIAQAIGLRPSIRLSHPKPSHGVKARMPRWDVEMGQRGNDTYRCELEEAHTWRKVRSVAHDMWDGHVFNMEVSGDNSYVAEGIGVHNCVGHGGVGSLVTLRAMHGLGRERLSPCNLYGQINGGQDHGALVVDALKALRDGPGVCLESTVGPTHWQPGSWPASWKEEAGRFKLEKATEIQGFDAIGTALMEGDPVCFGIEIGQAFEPGADGVIPDRRGSGGGHCMFTVGLKQVSGRWHVQVVNSWGTRWGANGICYLPESYFAGWHEAYRLKTGIDNPQGDNPPNVKGS